MKIIPCADNPQFSKEDVDRVAEKIKTESHSLGGHNMDEDTFYRSGLFRSAIERIRGQFSANMGPKREFAALVFNHMEDKGFIRNWESSDSASRHDYEITLNSGAIAIVELKGCMDGNNTTIFERPPNANEFIVWSVCTNVGSKIEKNVWSGVHSRIGPEMIVGKKQVVDGLIVWDWHCGSHDRPCPKADKNSPRRTVVGPHSLPPPCLYVFPATIANPHNNPMPPARDENSVGLLKAFFDCFNCTPDEIYQVLFEAGTKGTRIVRTTRFWRDGSFVRNSGPKVIKRS